MSGYLTPFWLAASVAVFLGLGTASLVGGTWVIPWIRNKSHIGDLTFDIGEKRDIDRLYQNRLARWFFKSFLRVPRTSKIIRSPAWFLVYLIPYSVAFLAVMDTTLELLTSVGLRNPLSWTGLYYDFVFARSNGLPNGSHIESYLGVVALMWIVAIKYRDGLFPNLFLGLLCGFMMVGVHEAIWVVFYYAQYGQYLHFGTLAPNIISDATSFAMYLMFVVGYWRYPHDKPPMRAFMIPSLIMLAYITLWFFVPHLFGYTYFPITTVNNPEFGQTIYNETQYWADPWTNGVESLSWLLPFVAWTVVVLLARRTPSVDITSAAGRAGPDFWERHPTIALAAGQAALFGILSLVALALLLTAVVTGMLHF